MKQKKDGSRFKKLVKELKKKGDRNPAALAAYIGRKKYGVKEFEKLSMRGRRKM